MTSSVRAESINTLLPTTVMGSYPQPAWLVDRKALVGAGVPRVRAEGIWRVDREQRAEAIEAATLVAIADQEAAGVDIITDGEIGRESYFNHFATSLGGVDQEHTGVGVNRKGGKSDVPLVNGPIRREAPIELDSARFLRAHTDRKTKVTVPGPFTLSQLAQNDHYPDQRALAMAYATAVNEELRDLQAAGIDMLQIDEPYMQANAEAAEEFAIEAITAALDGITASTTLHTCYGYAIYMNEKSGGYPFLSPLAALPVDYIAIEAAQPKLSPETAGSLAPRGVVFGVIDLGSLDVESPETVASRIRPLTDHIDPAKLSVAPDCGMKYLPRPVAQAKLAAMVAGAAIVRSELAG
ncbi:MAG: 5-methyltetrahydropteroyltriglutamate--homocysteine methyltransferase [Acidimicrobiales bacterium]|jgi:5-methyltetrahydropteroyltriglutamate--homocysteine methyltransferase